MTNYKCFNCGEELRTEGDRLVCDNDSCGGNYPLDRYFDPAIIVVRNCWDCPLFDSDSSNVCTKLDQEIGNDMGPLPNCPLLKMSELVGKENL